jgi:hypothetical protein
MSRIHSSAASPLRALLSVSAALFAPLALRATTATSLSSFGGIEEPTVIYHPSTNTFTTGDTYVNITNPSSGVFQMLLRYSTTAWDGDRDTTNTDRQRAEVKTLGPNQLKGQTFIYTTTWRTNPQYVGSGGFDHITQLKPVDGVEGSSGAPLVTTSIAAGTSSANVNYASTSFSPADVFSPRIVRSFTWAPNTWLAEAIKVTPSGDGQNTGEVEASINGDAYQGVTGTEVSRPSSTTYYPKWGLYRGVSTTSGFSPNDYVQHSNVTATQVTVTTVSMEAENLSVTNSGVGTSVQSDSNSSGGKWVELEAKGTGSWMQFTTTSIPAGTYQLQMEWKGNDDRGQLSLEVDGGSQLGSTLDQYSADESYPTTTFGTVTFGSSGTHTIRLTVTGKNSKSSGYLLSADKFTFLGQ